MPVRTLPSEFESMTAYQRSRFADTDPMIWARMSRVRKSNTKPEMAVRRLVHRMGYRFRLHRKDLPGTPDLVFPGRRKVIFVHGCFWHQHAACRQGGTPRTRTEYWGPKLRRNVERDEQNQAALAALGWATEIVWECESRDEERLRGRLLAFLGPPAL